MTASPQYTDDGGGTGSRLYIGSKLITNLGLARAISMRCEYLYMMKDPEMDEDVLDD